ncbi:MAG: conserved membrane protein of unknown function [Candidatus Thorarchaeota archaeon]|nr:MAG: conserved membrane protein of unknown function [Candidatus Thorarchaeota archaeon]
MFDVNQTFNINITFDQRAMMKVQLIMSTNFNTLIDDLKSSFKLAKDNALSYFLANLGMLVLVAILFAIVAIPIGLIAFAATLQAGPQFWIQFGQDMTLFAQNNPLLVGGVGILFMIPIIALFLIVVGSIYGMSKEVVETGETKAESAFSWFRHKFLTFAGAGVMLTLIIIVPQLLVWGAASLALGPNITYPANVPLTIFSWIYSYITVGFCAMVFPSITAGNKVQDAFKESFNLAKTRFDRVFGLLTAVIVLFLVMFAPAIIGGIVASFTMNPPPATLPLELIPLVAVIGGWSVIAVILWLVLLLPMTIIAFQKVYAELTGGKIATEQSPDIPLV